LQNEHPLHLLIVDESLNDAETLISDLRNTGYALRGQHAESLEGAITIMESKAVDLFICSALVKQLSIQQAAEAIRRLNKDITLLALADKHDAELRRKVMRDGAHDLISKDDREHLKLVVKREVVNIQQRREARRADKALHEINKRCHTLLESSRDAITYITGGMHIYANPVYLEQFGFVDLDDISGTTFMDLVAKKDHPQFKDLLRRLDHHDQKPESIELTLTAHSNEFPALLDFSPASYDGEPCTQVVIRRQNNNDELEQKLVNLRQRDVLTGLFNRQYFMELLAETCTGDGTGAVLYVDLEGFGRIRERVGIAAADLILNEFTSLLKNKLDTGWKAARFDDHSFAVLMGGKSSKDALQIAEVIRRGVEEHIAEVENQTVSMTTSIGISVIGNDGSSAQTIIEQALEARQQAVLAGGNRVMLYQGAEQKNAAQSKAADEQWGQRIMESFANNRFFMVYLPIANLHGDGGERYEALLRMTTNAGEPISPGSFLPAAERQGLMRDIDRWVVREVIRGLATRRQNGNNTVCFIKLSESSLLDESILPWLSNQLAEAKLPADQLVFELTENMLITHVKEAKNITKGLKQLRCGVLVDQFGSGLNSFQLLKNIPADYLKVDAAITAGLPRNPDNQAALKNIVTSAHQLGKLVLVGNVEDAPSLAILWQYGVNLIQGFFLQEPTPEMGYDFSEMVM
jgi:multidomain signaling protein FimX